MKSVQYRSTSIFVPFTVLLVVSGTITGISSFFVAAGIPAFLLFLTQLRQSPSPDQIVIHRSIDETAPSPGQEVTITVSVKNTGNKTATDVRIIDPVPDQLVVTQGSPRAAVAVRPGDIRQYQYTIVARRGTHSFDTVPLEIRGGHPAHVASTKASGDDQIQCTTTLDDIVLRDTAGEQVGDIITHRGGSGIEFHALRDYKSSDPPSRVEWKHLAKTGDLATKQFREERAGDIVLVVDVRPVADQKAAAGHPSGTDLAVYAAKQAYRLLLKGRHRPGVILLGIGTETIPVQTDAALLPYIKPGRTQAKRSRVKHLLDAVDDASKQSVADMGSKLYRLLPPNAQMVCFSPLLDDSLPTAVKLLATHGYPSIIGSPDVTYGKTLGGRLHSMGRDLRVRRMRRYAPVVDWDVSRSLAIQVADAMQHLYAGGVKR